MRVSLILGSGGARGWAHIGVIREILDRGHEVVSVSGASIGALVGGAFAAGHLAELAEWSASLTRGEVIRLSDFTLNEPGLVRGRRLMARIADIIGEVRIEDLPIPYTAVATDVQNRREVWFRDGPLIPAIRASIAIPTAFTPVVIGDRLLVDGGVLNPLPIEPSMEQTSDVTVAVSLFGRRPGVGRRSPLVQSSDDTHEVRWTHRLSEQMSDALSGRGVAQLFSRHRASSDEYETLPPDLGIADVMSMSLDAMQSAIQTYRIAMNPPDVLVQVPRASCGTFDFHHASRLIDLGRELAASEFDRAGL